MTPFVPESAGHTSERMDDPSPTALEAGAKNLLLNCVGAKYPDSVLVVREDSRHGYYDDAAPDCVEEIGRALGLNVSRLVAPLIAGPSEFPSEIGEAMQTVDHTIFFSRIGDQMRFQRLPGSGTKTMCYALDAGFLASEFCTVPHMLMQEILDRLQTELARATQWRITCPRGTDLVGRCRFSDQEPVPDNDFSLKLFPITTFAPIRCDDMDGRVILAHWLMGTANNTYDPFALMLDRPVTAVINHGRVSQLEGEPGAVERVRDHYARVSALFGIDRDVIHSWHTGIHPKTFYPTRAAENLERWGGVAFGSPRYTHFHTCGDYSPGEIAWSVFDATIYFDGEPYWKDGRFVFLEREDIKALRERYHGTERAFEMRRDIGI